MKKVEEVKVVPLPPAEVRNIAYGLYVPPFRYHCGYIFDSRNRMVADDNAFDCAARIRGWGRIGYMDHAEQIQDESGIIIAEALNAHYEQLNPNTRPVPLCPVSEPASQGQKDLDQPRI